MKKGSLFLLIFFILLGAFSFFIIKSANSNITATYNRCYRSTFQILSLMVDRYFTGEIEYKRKVTAEVKDRYLDKSSAGVNIKNVIKEENNNLSGYWEIDDSVLSGFTDLKEHESQIIDFHRSNLMGREASILIFLDDKPFYLVNTDKVDREILLLVRADYPSYLRVENALDSLVKNSNLLYFSVLDGKEQPLLFSSIYDNYLPLQGVGEHVIHTPGGKIFQIEKMLGERKIVGGFSMELLTDVTTKNNYLLIIILFLFFSSAVFLIYKYINYERLKVRKSQEISYLKELSGLSSGFAHEFRNSLNTLALLAKKLEGSNKKILKEEVHRMRTFMDSLKLIAQDEVKKKKLNINNLLDESISMIGELINNEIKIKREAGSGLEVVGSKTLLVTAFSNILRNALEAKADFITIRSFSEGDNVYIEFIDNGEGIDNEKLGKIFEPFYSGKGQSGLGLYLVRKIIEAHEGEINVKSGVETRVRVILNG